VNGSRGSPSVGNGVPAAAVAPLANSNPGAPRRCSIRPRTESLLRRKRVEIGLLTPRGHSAVRRSAQRPTLTRAAGCGNRPRNAEIRSAAGILRMELAGLEPATSWVRSRRALPLSLPCLQGLSRCWRPGLRSTISASFRPFRLGSGQGTGLWPDLPCAKGCDVRITTTAAGLVNRGDDARRGDRAAVDGCRQGRPVRRVEVGEYLCGDGTEEDVARRMEIRVRRQAQLAAGGREVDVGDLVAGLKSARRVSDRCRHPSEQLPTGQGGTGLPPVAAVVSPAEHRQHGDERDGQGGRTTSARPAPRPVGGHELAGLSAERKGVDVGVLAGWRRRRTPGRPWRSRTRGSGLGSSRPG
jgi:hypothetical protein